MGEDDNERSLGFLIMEFELLLIGRGEKVGANGE